MAPNKKSFILYADIETILENLPREIKGDLFQMIVDYVNDKNPTTEDVLLKTAFAPIKSQLKRDLVKWVEIREKRSFAGQKSAESKSQQKQQVLTSVESVEQTPTKSTVSVTVNDTVNVNEKVIKKKVAFAPPTCVEVENYFSENGFMAESGKKAWHYYQTAGWKDSRGKNVLNWKQKMQGVWFKEENKMPQHKQETKSIYTPPIKRG